MNILRYGAGLLQRTSPAGLLLGGAAVALTIPPVRRGLRAAAVAATRGVLSITGEAKHHLQQMQATADPKADSCIACDVAEKIRSKPRKLAVAATMGALAVSDKAKALVQDANDSIKSIIEEAKNPHTAAESGDDTDIHDGLEGEFSELPKPQH